MTTTTHPVMTVLGPRGLGAPGVFDAHTHVWIDVVDGGEADAPRLDDDTGIRADLWRFASRGGCGLIDCQPPGAGRNARRLVDLAAATGIAIVACTGFHLPQYYPATESPWGQDPEVLARRFGAELSVGMRDDAERMTARAGAVKAAHPGSLGGDTGRMFEAAVSAAAAAGVMLVIHTERGRGVEELVDSLLEHNMSSQDVMLCHVDKRPDLELHRELARAGFLLEYDTFLRPKYDPQDNVYPLIENMLADGHGDAIACGLDLADASLWAFRGGPGACALSDVVTPELRRRGAAEHQIRAVTGDNVRRRLQGAGLKAAAA